MAGWLAGLGWAAACLLGTGFGPGGGLLAGWGDSSIRNLSGIYPEYEGRGWRAAGLADWWLTAGWLTGWLAGWLIAGRLVEMQLLNIKPILLMVVDTFGAFQAIPKSMKYQQKPIKYETEFSNISKSNC